MNVKFRIRNHKQVQRYLKTVVRGGFVVGLKAFVDYILGNQSRGLRHYPSYKYVSRKSAYGKTFFSDAQRRFVMAAIRDGRIDPGVPHRTGRVQRGWYAAPTRKGYGFMIYNKEPGAYYTMDDKGQARQPALVGWQKVSKVITDNFKGAVRVANAAIKKVLPRRRK
jgi:hypothetical protein